MGPGRIITEHDVLPTPGISMAGVKLPLITAEAGQADSVLSGWLGIDHQVKGGHAYRPLGRHRDLPSRSPSRPRSYADTISISIALSAKGTPGCSSFTTTALSVRSDSSACETAALVSSLQPSWRRPRPGERGRRGAVAAAPSMRKGSPPAVPPAGSLRSADGALQWAVGCPSVW